MAETPRSCLFVPGDRPERFDKALASGADRIVLDLEDAVMPQGKLAARDAVGAWLAAHPGVPAIVRINAWGTPWFEDDLAMLARHEGAGLMLPKAEPDALAATAGAAAGCPLVALVETVKGLLSLREMLATGRVRQVAFGSIDFGLDAGMSDGDEEPGMTCIRVQIALECRLAGVAAPIDGVTVEIEGDAARRQAARARALGFGGKLCIHPRQVAGIHAAFDPTPEELAWADRVTKAFDQAGGAAVAVDGKMVDKPVVDRARRLLDRKTP